MKRFKQKTNSSAKKRFKITGTGKVTRRKTGLRHILSGKSSRVKVRKQGDFILSPSNKKKAYSINAITIGDSK